MKIKLMMLFLAVTTMAMIWGCGQKLPEGVVMIVDGDEMTTDDFRNLAFRRFGGEMMIATQTRAAMDDYVETVLESELKAADGRAKGYSNRPEVLTAYEEARAMAAIGELYQRVIVDSLIPEDMLQKLYEGDANEINASHILIRIDADTDSAAAMEAVIQIRSDLIAEHETVDSTVFAAAATEHSEDETAEGGNLGFFRRGEMVPSFENMAFGTAINSMSEPVYTPFGWHLLFVHELRPVPDRATFEEDRDRIKQLAMREHGQELMNAARNYVFALEDAREVEFQMNNITTVFNTINPRLPATDPFSFLTEDQLQLALVTYDDGEFLASDLRPYVNQHMSNRKFEDANMVKAIVENYTTEKVLLPGDAEARGFLSLPEVLNQAKIAADTRIRQIVNQEVSKLPEATDEDLMTYYEEHSEDYLLDAQYTLIEVLVKERELADSIKAMVESGEYKLKDLAVEHTIRSGVAEKEGIFGPIRKAQHGAIGRRAAEAEIGTLVGPLRSQDKWSVFKVISKEEPRADDFENVRDRVNVDWRTWAREDRQTTYMDSLKSAIDYTVHRDAISIAFPEIIWADEVEDQSDPSGN